MKINGVFTCIRNRNYVKGSDKINTWALEDGIFSLEENSFKNKKERWKNKKEMKRLQKLGRSLGISPA